MTSSEPERINVILTRIVSSTEFWIKIQTDDDCHESYPYSDTNFDEQKTYSDYLRWIKGTECNFEERKKTKQSRRIFL